MNVFERVTLQDIVLVLDSIDEELAVLVAQVTARVPCIVALSVTVLVFPATVSVFVEDRLLSMVMPSCMPFIMASSSQLNLTVPVELLHEIVCPEGGVHWRVSVPVPLMSMVMLILGRVMLTEPEPEKVLATVTTSPDFEQARVMVTLVDAGSICARACAVMVDEASSVIASVASSTDENAAWLVVSVSIASSDLFPHADVAIKKDKKTMLKLLKLFIDPPSGFSRIVLMAYWNKEILQLV